MLAQLRYFVKSSAKAWPKALAVKKSLYVTLIWNIKIYGAEFWQASRRSVGCLNYRLWDGPRILSDELVVHSLAEHFYIEFEFQQNKIKISLSFPVNKIIMKFSNEKSWAAF